MGEKCLPDELRTLFLFEALSDAQLQMLCDNGHIQAFEPGPIVVEGDPATCLYVLLEGELVMSKRSGGVDIETTRTSQRGVYCGASSAYIPGAESAYQASVRVTKPSRFFVLDADAFARFMQSEFPMAVHLLEGHMVGGLRQRQIIGQREKLLALGQLSAGLTHQLNNPAAATARAVADLRDRVAGMRHKLAMLADGKFTPETELLMNQIVEASKRISALLAGARQYSQMDRAPYQTADIHELLHSTVMMFGDKIGKDNAVKLVKDLDKSLPELLCYPGDLNQVWTNIIDNAIQAMDGSGTLTLRTMRENEEMIRVEICDDGPGIPADIIGNIFNPFFTTKPFGEGTGLGLDLARRIVVEKHHGDLRVKSEPGHTKFVVLLPLVAPAPELPTPIELPATVE